MKKLKELGIIAGVDYIGVGVGAVILDEQGKMLLGLRSGMVRNDAGKWDCPGGGGTPQEPLGQAIVRECQEEIDVLVNVGKHLPYVEHFTDNQHWISCAFLCEISSGTPKIMEP
ncbi:MAG TPA: NUDIX domain-containing protein, partial [Ktedonobacteraceae bacterium]|nr:NUDIX domain-containing protein [Ktedonobacteraceae bacterium]